jgi:tetratricopeptide (TPR) repeat protein
MEDIKSEHTAVGTRLGDLLLQKGIEHAETASYEAKITYLEREISRLEEKNMVLSGALEQQKRLVRKMQEEKASAQELLFKRAVQELKKDNYIDAMGLLQAMLLYEPENMKGLINLSVAYAELGYYDKAKATLHEVIRHDPDNEVAKRNLAVLSDA